MVTVQPLVGTSVTITETFSVDGTPLDLDSGVPTIVALYPDGTAVTPAPTASGTWVGPPARTTGQYRIVLPGEAECTILDPITWTGTIGGQPQTLYSRVEWVGNHLFTIGALRALKTPAGQPFAATATPLYSDAQLADARAAVLDEFEQILGFPPVPRFKRVVLDGTGGYCLSPTGGVLKDPRLLSVSVNGTAQSTGAYRFTAASQLQAVSNYGAGTAFTAGYGNITVEMVHGWVRVMGDGANMAMMVAAAQLNPGTFTSATTVTMGDGNSYTYEPSGAARSGFVNHTGIRVVDRWLNRWSELVGAVA